MNFVSLIIIYLLFIVAPVAGVLCLYLHLLCNNVSIIVEQSSLWEMFASLTLSS